MIRIVFSTDIPGFGHIATVVASILRRTREHVSVRIYTRGFSQPDFEIANLSVQFIRNEEPVDGRYPGHVSPAVFDRLRIIRDFDDWDRVLVLDHDMLILCDLSAYFRETFDGALLMGRLFGKGNTVGLQMKQRGGLPESWKHAEDHPYFFMGPMMNLEAMRVEGFWDKLLAAHSAIGQDEQISLTAASEGRVKGVSKRWNLVPQWDKLEEKSKLAMENPENLCVIDDVIWRDGLPEGLIHWTGYRKPWHHKSSVWRADLWASELCTWEHLRAGIWNKPRAVEIVPETSTRYKALLTRGWKVEAIHINLNRCGEPGYPDLVQTQEIGDSSFRNDFDLSSYDMVRFGPRGNPVAWLDEGRATPDRIVVEGPRNTEDMRQFRAFGYCGESRIQRNQWPAGGPHPKTLTYFDTGKPLAVGRGEDAYLSRLSEEWRKPVQHETLPTTAESPEEPNNLIEFFSQKPSQWSGTPANILLLGINSSSSELIRLFPGSRMIAIEHDPLCILTYEESLHQNGEIEILHAPLDTTLPWYDFSRIDPPQVDLVISSLPAGLKSNRFRFGAIGLKRHLRHNGLIVLDASPESWSPDDLAIWGDAGFELLEADATVSVFRINETARTDPEASEASSSSRKSSWKEEIGKTYIISLPSREDRRESLRSNWELLGLDYEFVDAVRPDPESILWTEMSGLEAHGKASNLRSDYVVGAVGCKRSGIMALEKFLESQAATALICQDDCHWIQGAEEIITKAFSQLPEKWDLLYFSASARKPHIPYSTHLIKLQHARLCTAILWRRETAEDLLPRLKQSNCEWDVFMGSVHSQINAFCIIPMPAYQERFHSDITGAPAKPPNV